VRNVPTYHTPDGEHPKSLLAIAVGNTGLKSGLINKMVVAFGSGVGNFTMILFHYDTADFTVYPWYNDVLHIVVQGQMKWWYAKRFLAPQVVSSYEYLFLWDEDLDVERFWPQDYLETCRAHKLALSTPAYDLHRTTKNSTWKLMVQREKNSSSSLAHMGSTTSTSSGVRKTNFVEVSAPVFRSDAWSCVWETVHNDLASGWGYDLLWYNACKDIVGNATGVLDFNVVAHISGGSASSSLKFRPRARLEEKEFFVRMSVPRVRPGNFAPG